MSSFEYVMVIVSIIMGLGITSLLRGMVHTLRAETGWKPSILHSLWVANMLVLHVGLWSVRWSGETQEEWSFMLLMAFLFLPILYYAMAELLFPRTDQSIDLSDYFLANRKIFFGSQVLNMIASTVGPFIFYGGENPVGDLSGPEIFRFVMPVVLAGVHVSMVFTENKRIHSLWAAANLVLFTMVFAVLRVG